MRYKKGCLSRALARQLRALTGEQLRKVACPNRWSSLRSRRTSSWGVWRTWPQEGRCVESPTPSSSRSVWWFQDGREKRHPAQDVGPLQTHTPLTLPLNLWLGHTNFLGGNGVTYVFWPRFFSFLSVVVVLCMQLGLILRTCWKILLNVLCPLSPFGLDSLGKEGKLPAGLHTGCLWF